MSSGVIMAILLKR